jgi:hypothetical protein
MLTSKTARHLLRRKDFRQDGTGTHPAINNEKFLGRTINFVT